MNDLNAKAAAMSNQMMGKTGPTMKPGATAVKSGAKKKKKMPPTGAGYFSK